MVSIATFFMDEELVRSQIQSTIGSFIGTDFAKSLSGMMSYARLQSSGLTTLVFGGGILLFGATGFFNQLKVSFTTF